jgi:hypothetical protein
MTSISTVICLIYVHFYYVIRASRFSNRRPVIPACFSWPSLVESSWNVMAHGDVRVRKWRGNWRMEWVATTLHTTLEHSVSSITTADVHTSAASSRLNWSPCRFKWTLPFHRKMKSGFCSCTLVYHHISKAVYLQLYSELRLKLGYSRPHTHFSKPFIHLVIQDEWQRPKTTNARLFNVSRCVRTSRTRG